MHAGFQTHEGQIIGHIQPFLILSACNQILKQAVARKSICTARITAFIQVIEFNPDTIQ